MTASIARYLKDFGEPTPAPPVLVDDVGDCDFGGGFDMPEPVIEPPVDLAAERAEAHAQGFAAGAAEAKQAWEEERERLLKMHADELAATKVKYEADIALIVEKKLSETAVLIAEAVSTQTARILAPVVEQTLVDKAVADLSDLLRIAILEGEAAIVVLRGPTDLFEKLKASLGAEHEALLRHVEAADLDLSAEMGDAALVTRLSAWSARLKEVLA